MTYQIKHKINEIESVQKAGDDIIQIQNTHSYTVGGTHTHTDTHLLIKGKPGASLKCRWRDSIKGKPKENSSPKSVFKYFSFLSVINVIFINITGKVNRWEAF